MPSSSAVLARPVRTFWSSERRLRTDFSIAGELLHELLAFAFAYRGDKPQPNLHVAFRRFVCIVWLTRPEFLGNKPLMDLGPELGCTRANLSKLIRDFGDSLGGLRNRLHTEQTTHRAHISVRRESGTLIRIRLRPVLAAPASRQDINNAGIRENKNSRRYG